MSTGSASPPEEYFLLPTGESFSSSPPTPGPRKGLLSGAVSGAASYAAAAADAAVSSSLRGTGNVLKTAGSVTSSYVLGPSAHLIARDVLPEVLSLLASYARDVTPQRGRDIARIFGSGGRSLLSLLSGTARGQALLRQNGAAFDSALSALSSPAGRQLVVEAAAWFLRRAEAAATPEAKAAGDAGVVALCRLLDLAASAHAKEFYHAAADSWWDLSRLCADPGTAAAAAEVSREAGKAGRRKVALLSGN